MNVRKRAAMALCVALLAGCVAADLGWARTVRREDYGVKLAAAEYMAEYMAEIRAYKQVLGLELSPEDWHETGMIGIAWSPITTTSGALEAKRTCANPDMAALSVQLLEEAGVRPGDTVGAGFSGSFPALNLAVLAACRAMGVEVIYIASVGASTYGANQPELTFPDMLQHLVSTGLLDQPPAMNTLGGYMDCGLDMDEAVRGEILARLRSYETPVLYEEDFQRNVGQRMALYQQQGPIDCFVGVGGNMTTSGRNEVELGWGVVDPAQVCGINEGSGLVERYAAAGIPVVYLLNIRRLVADYGLPYDPETLPAPGESAIYYKTELPALPGVLGVGGSAALLWWGSRRRKETE